MRSEDSMRQSVPWLSRLPWLLPRLWLAAFAFFTLSGAETRLGLSACATACDKQCAASKNTASAEQWHTTGTCVAKAGPVRIADGALQIGLDPADGTLRELVELPGGYNQLADDAAPHGLWRMTVCEGSTSREISAERVGPPKIERLPDVPVGLRLAWNVAAAEGKSPLGVEVVVRLGPPGRPGQPGQPGRAGDRLSRWELSVSKPRGVRLAQIRFPRVPGLRQRSDEVLAVAKQLGLLARDPRKLTQGPGPGNKGQGSQGQGRLSWFSPHGTDLSIPCLAFYQQDGPGFYAACEDTQGYPKEFALEGDRNAQLHFEIVHAPQQEAVGSAEFRLPFVTVLGSFRGDWTTAAAIYRASPSAKTIAARGRLRRRSAPAWLDQTGLWLWNRGRSQQVLEPAGVLRKHLEAPVSVLWHWWHHCPYDAGFPEFLPPREGTESFRTALAAARRQDIHAILYMNQRLWGMKTQSWTDEGAEAWAVKEKDGKIRPEVYNVFMKTPCVPMCIATQFWRDKYAGIAQEALCGLAADGIYMDQAGCWASCYDPRHGHIVGPGRYWTEGLSTLAAEIRRRSASRGPVALGAEYCGEPWIGDVDLNLALAVSHDRMGMASEWEPIPFFPAVYHESTVVFGSLAGLVYPPYDEKWPQQKASPKRLTLLDRRFAGQFYLDHARTFAWGMQPMLANFLPSHLEERPEEMDYVTRIVRTRMRSWKYLRDGTWLRPPALDVPRREIDVAALGVYTPLRASKRTYPVALAGAWRAPDGDVGIALASIHDQPLPLSLALALPPALTIDAAGYGLPERCAVYRIDHTGRHRLGAFDRRDGVYRLTLPPRGICVIEFCRSEKAM